MLRGLALTIAPMIAVALQCACAAAAEPIRLGWQTTWATQGQLVMGLRHSNIPELVGVELDYAGFAFGGPLNQAALAGQVDVLLTADQPAVALMSRTPAFRVVARMMYNRTCIYVPTDSGIAGLADLAGRTVAGPVGAAAERVALAALLEAGVSLDSVTFGNIDMARQSILVSAGSAGGRWAAFDALYGFDPMPAVFEAEGAARMIHCGKVVSVVMASDAMLTTRRDELERFLVGFQLSWALFAREPERMNALFLKSSNVSFSPRALEIAARIEPNRSATGLEGIRLSFTEADLAVFDTASAFLVARKAIAAPLDIRDPSHLDLSVLHAALASGRAAALVDRIVPGE